MSYAHPLQAREVSAACAPGLANSSSTADCALIAVAIDDAVMFTHVTVRGNVVTIRQIESASGAVRDQVTITKSQL